MEQLHESDSIPITREQRPSGVVLAAQPLEFGSDADDVGENFASVLVWVHDGDAEGVSIDISGLYGNADTVRLIVNTSWLRDALKEAGV